MQKCFPHFHNRAGYNKVITHYFIATSLLNHVLTRHPCWLHSPALPIYTRITEVSTPLNTTFNIFSREVQICYNINVAVADTIVLFNWWFKRLDWTNVMSVSSTSFWWYQRLKTVTIYHQNTWTNYLYNYVLWFQ